MNRKEPWQWLSGIDACSTLVSAMVEAFRIKTDDGKTVNFCRSDNTGESVMTRLRRGTVIAMIGNKKLQTGNQ